MPPQTKGPPGYVWSDGKYYTLNPNGRRGKPISELSFIENLRQIHEAQAEVLGELVEGYYEGDLSLVTVEKATKAELKSLHLSMAALAVGGWENVSSSVATRTERDLRKEYQYLAAFMLLITTGELKRDAAVGRARLYADGGYGTFWRESTILQRLLGRSQELLIPQPGACRQCLSLAALGWQPLGTYTIPVHVNCRCGKEYK